MTNQSAEVLLWAPASWVPLHCRNWSQWGLLQYNLALFFLLLVLQHLFKSYPTRSGVLLGFTWQLISSTWCPRSKSVRDQRGRMKISSETGLEVRMWIWRPYGIRYEAFVVEAALYSSRTGNVKQSPTVALQPTAFSSEVYFTAVFCFSSGIASCFAAAQCHLTITGRILLSPSRQASV